MKTYLTNQWNKNPLLLIIITAFCIRLVAAVFSQGYGMHDDHFITIEEPWSWTQDADFDGWLPGAKGEDSQPSIYTFFYPGINYYTFTCLDAVGVTNPKSKMFIVRLFLALFSLLTVYYGYLIAKFYSSERKAKQVGILLALFWFMPFLSVRNLVEIVVIPVLLASTWLIIKYDFKADSKRRLYGFLWAGIIAGLSLSIRFQAVIYIGGLGLVLLLQRKFWQSVVFGTGIILSFLVLQGVVDYFIWNEPFATMKGYIDYNLTHKTAFGNQDNVLMYFELIPGILLPPLGIFIFVGFFFKIKKHLLVFLPTLLFILFHTYFPNRQERFILTVVPMVLIIGFLGWEGFVEKSKFWINRGLLRKYIYRFFWVLNVILLVVLTFTYSKRSRIETMYYFSKLDEPVNTILVDDTGRYGNVMMPVFYAGKIINMVILREIDPNDKREYPNWSYHNHVYSFKFFEQNKDVPPPEYVIFVEDIDLDKRINRMKEYYPNLHYAGKIDPSFTDKMMKKLNPKNKNEDFFIYKTGL